MKTQSRNKIRRDEILPLYFVRNKKIILIGNYGDGNLGDEAILKALINYLHQNSVCTIYIPTKNVPFLKAEFRNNKVIPLNYFNIIKLIRAFLESDTIIIGGGGIYSKYSGFGVYVSTALSIIMKTIFKKKLTFVGIGFSNSTPYFLKIISRIALNIADYISVRDEKSYENLRSIGVKNKKIIITKDLTLTSLISPHPSTYGEQILKKEGISRSKLLIGIAVNGTNSRKNNQRLVYIFSDLIKWLLRKYDATIVFFQFCPAYVSKVPDRFFAEAIISKLPQHYKKRCKILNYYPPEAVMSILRFMNLLIGTRFHSLVFAYKVGVPFIGISYEEKCSNFLQKVGKKDFKIESVNLEELKAEIDKILEGTKC